MEQKLFLARNMLDNEGALRKKAEAERDRLSNQLTLLRKLVMDDHLIDEIKLNKLRNFENFDCDFEQQQPITSNATTPKVRVSTLSYKNRNNTRSLSEKY